jgi:hypothetical protein
MLAVYVAATFAVSGFVMGTAVNQAQARGNGGGRGGGGRGGGAVRGGGVVRGGGGVVRGGRGGVVRGGRGGRGRGIMRGGVWYPWIAPGFCHYPVTSLRVACPYY